ncbi:unnamed protein product [Rhizophagus irregularis]|uniref:Serine-threonine/tyrosine-protein kinase catalytic domain-containing protein n=1 Tax=Rhizophagus irregularis TaxID=588596 RepID=A0A915YV04_9GLOM|nr:unnamed protein product [Rhizophagus irregularis]
MNLSFNVRLIFMRISFTFMEFQQKTKLNLALQLSNAISWLHNKKIVHRDLHSNKILQGLREKPIPNTPEDYVKIYTDCWNIEPNNRPTINQD